MKLRNKRTGKIVDRLDITIREEGVVFNNDETYDSLAQLNAEWEDYEEPKEYWTIDWTCTGVTTSKYSDDDIDDFNKSIGNYFETKKEAEKAVEKLKAWKRLKDKGFVFKSINMTDGSIKTGLTKGVSIYACGEFYDDMNLLFGGEE